MPDGPGCFRQDSSCPALLRIPLHVQACSCTGLSPPSAGFPKPFHFRLSMSIVVLLPRNCLNNYGLGSSRFARHYSGNHCCFLFLRVLRCFSSPGLPSGCPEYPVFYPRMGCPIRISTDLWLFAPPRGFSQLITSFFASESLGIPRTPLLTFFSSLFIYSYSFFFSLVIDSFFPACQRTFTLASASQLAPVRR